MIKRIAANKHFRNVSWNLADAIIYPLALLIATPFYLDRLGDELYGLWTLLTSIILSIGVLNGGLADTTIKFVSKHLALEHEASAERVFTTTYSLTLALGLCILLSSPFLSWGIVALDLFEIPRHLEENTILFLIISLATLALKLVEQIFFAYFKAYEKFNVFSKASISIRVGTIVVNVLLLALGYQLLHLLLSTLAISFLGVISIIIYIVKQKGGRILLPRFDKATLLELKSYTSWSWFHTLINVANSQMDKFIVASLAGLQTLTYYSIGLMVVNQIHMVLSTGTSTVFPVISKKEALNQSTSFLFSNLQQLVTLTGLLVILHLALLQDFIFTIWLGQEAYSKAEPLIQLFFMYQLVASTSVVSYFYLIGSGRVKQNAFSQLFNTSLMAVLMAGLFYSFGEQGLVIGKALALFFTTTILFSYLKRAVFPEISTSSLYKSIALSLVAVAVLITGNGYVTVLFLLYLYYLVFDLAHKNNLWRRLFYKS